jgi:hypothetical protein
VLRIAWCPLRWWCNVLADLKVRVEHVSKKNLKASEHSGTEKEQIVPQSPSCAVRHCHATLVIFSSVMTSSALNLVASPSKPLASLSSSDPSLTPFSDHAWIDSTGREPFNGSSSSAFISIPSMVEPTMYVLFNNSRSVLGLLSFFYSVECTCTCSPLLARDALFGDLTWVDPPENKLSALNW